MALRDKLDRRASASDGTPAVPGRVRHPYFGGRREAPGRYLRGCVIVLYPLIALAFKHRWQRIEQIPAEGPAIIAVNHISYADPFVVARFIWDAGRNPRYLAKASLFSIPFFGRIVTGAGQIPVHRGTADADHALADAVEALHRGEMVLIFPEGTVTRDPDFWPMQPKTGVARLALLVPEAPVIPVGQWGSQEFLDFYHRKFRPLPRKRVAVSAGDPVDLSKWAGAEPTNVALHEMADAIMTKVREQVAELRDEPAPAEFFVRPAGAGVRARDARPLRREQRRRAASEGSDDSPADRSGS